MIYHMWSTLNSTKHILLLISYLLLFKIPSTYNIFLYFPHWQVLNASSIFFCSLNITMGASLVAQMVKNQPATQEICIRSLSQENLLEKGMDTHFSILGWRIPWTEEPGRLQSMVLQRVGHDWETNIFTFIFSLTIALSLFKNIDQFQFCPKHI